MFFIPILETCLNKLICGEVHPYIVNLTLHADLRNRRNFPRDLLFKVRRCVGYCPHNLTSCAPDPNNITTHCVAIAMNTPINGKKSYRNVYLKSHNSCHPQFSCQMKNSFNNDMFTISKITTSPCSC